MKAVKSIKKQTKNIAVKNLPFILGQEKSFHPQDMEAGVTIWPNNYISR